MDYDFLDRDFLRASQKAIAEFREAGEKVRPPESELKKLCKAIRLYPHTAQLKEEFTVAGVDGSGEFPILQQDDIFVHFSVSAGKNVPLPVQVPEFA